MSLNIFSPESIRRWDQHTITREPVSSLDLMERAATACTKHILASHVFQSAAVFCGTGNNGGDGLVIARLLHERGITVTVYIVELSGNASADFKTNLDRLPKQIKPIHLTEKKPDITLKAELIIDAIFGSGLNRSVSGWIGGVIDQLNTSEIPIVAVDIPSGLFCLDNRSNELKHVIKAQLTISFQSPKMVFLYADYANYVGLVKTIDIGLAADFDETPFARYTTRHDLKLHKRDTFSHKGTHGYLFLIAGFQHYAGAAVLAAQASLRSGSGYVAVHCAKENRAVLLSTAPECLYVEEIHQTFPEKTTAIAIGPGLGTDQHALNVLTRVLAENKPLVLDADALNLLASHRTLLEKMPANSILTPHPAELKRLIGTFSTPEETLEKQVEFSTRHRVFVIQKGAYSKITTPDGQIIVNSSGNPGMASAGMGDVLTGIIGSMLAQGYSAQDAAVFGTYLHGHAADLVKREQGETGMIASDVIRLLPKAINF